MGAGDNRPNGPGDVPQQIDWFLLAFVVAVGPIWFAAAMFCRRRLRPAVQEAAAAAEGTGAAAPLAGPEWHRQESGASLHTSFTDVVSRSVAAVRDTGQLAAARSNGSANGDCENGREAGAGAQEAASLAPSRSPTGRIVYLDFWRTYCVCLVCITHGTQDVYVRWNVVACQQWALPIICLISGSLYAKSRQHVVAYSARLALYFSCGCALNGFATIVTGIKWWQDEFDMAVMFQMSFVILFIGGAIVAKPLKSQLQARMELDKVQHARRNLIIYLILLCVAAGVQVAFWCLNFEEGDQGVRLTSYCFATALLAALGCRLLPAGRVGLLGWILLAWIYATRLVHREDRPGLEFHFVDLYMWAFVVQLVPLSGQAWIGQKMVHSWPIWAIACALIIVPGIQGRMDQHPFPHIVERFRQYVPEFVFVLAFTTIPCAGSGETLSFSEGAARHMSWLNYWSLFAYMAHKAVYDLAELIPVPLLGLVLVSGSMLIFYYTFGRRRRESPPNDLGRVTSAPGPM